MVTAKFKRVGLIWDPIPSSLIWCQMVFTAAKFFCSVERLQTIGKISNWLYKGTYSGKCIWPWDERSESLNLKLPAKAASLVCQASGSLHVNLRSLVSTKTQQIVRGDRFQFNWMLKNLLVTVLGWLDFQSILSGKLCNGCQHIGSQEKEKI